MPCASVSAKRTFTSVEKPKSTVELSTIGAVDAPALARLIRANQPCVVLTGAGVSTESGIQDFRSPTGIWAEFDPAEYASLPALRRDPQARRRLLRRAATGRRDRAGLRARTAGAAAARGRVLTRSASCRRAPRRDTLGRRPRCDRQQGSDALRRASRAEGGRERRRDPPRGCRGVGGQLGDRASQWTFPEESAALAAVHALDLVGNALPLAQRVARHLGMPVWCPSPERDCLMHLTQGSFVLGT